MLYEYTFLFLKIIKLGRELWGLIKAMSKFVEI